MFVFTRYICTSFCEYYIYNKMLHVIRVMILWKETFHDVVYDLIWVYTNSTGYSKLLDRGSKISSSFGTSSPIGRRGLDCGDMSWWIRPTGAHKTLERIWLISSPLLGIFWARFIPTLSKSGSRHMFEFESRQTQNYSDHEHEL